MAYDEIGVLSGADYSKKKGQDRSAASTVVRVNAWSEQHG